MDATWQAVYRLKAWLDRESTLPPDVERIARVMKVGAEAGEAFDACEGVLGRNPRKGVTNTWSDVHCELIDVVLSAMIALATLAADAPAVFARRAEVDPGCGPDAIWEAIGQAKQRRDRESVLVGETVLLARVLAIGASAGQAFAAYDEAANQMPARSMDAVCSALADVVIDAMIALVSLTADAADTFARRLQFVERRALQASAA
jgi:NTP pyrophosphatase (non-canonical NTP hydrolase)